MKPLASSEALRLTRIRFYPLKGASGLDLEEAELDEFGIPWDRRWMLVKPDGRFISQRTHPRLCLLRPGPGHQAGAGGEPRDGQHRGDLEPDGRHRGDLEPAGSGQGTGNSGAVQGEHGFFAVNAPGMEPIRFGPFPDSGNGMEVQVHSDLFTALVGDEETDRWFSSFLREPCKLVFIPGSVRRPVDPEFAPGHRVSFADGYPLHLTTEESLQALNGKLPSPLNMLRFRPNLVVAGGRPWAEDEWRRLEIGGLPLEVVKPCARCTVTTVDPGTGTRRQEPLRTLKGFRESGGKAYFGQNAVFHRRGRIRRGDPVRILSTGERRPPLS